MLCTSGLSPVAQEFSRASLIEFAGSLNVPVAPECPRTAIESRSRVISGARTSVGDVDESSRLVDDDANTYAVTKRDTDAALAAVDGITRVILRPPAILGAGESSIWNSVRPAEIRDDPQARHAVPRQSFAWVHVDDLAALAAEVAAGRIPLSSDPALGPVDGGCTPVNVAAGAGTQRDYYETVTTALGVQPVWDEGPAWTGRILADRARRWGWTPTVDLPRALAEIADGLRLRSG